MDRCWAFVPDTPRSTINTEACDTCETETDAGAVPAVDNNTAHHADIGKSLLLERSANDSSVRGLKSLRKSFSISFTGKKTELLAQYEGITVEKEQEQKKESIHNENLLTRKSRAGPGEPPGGPGRSRSRRSAQNSL